ncbi:hypothetical protein HDU82_003385 [Entophlyctis luteolus]|nr:hypothetical protein HDU82_003385 [Entophlyctis luteolus]
MKVRRATVVRAIAILVAVIAATALLAASRALHFVTYATRPLWDTPETLSFVVLPFFPPPVPAASPDADTVPPDGSLCRAHGWTPRGQASAARHVLDVILFSVELDLLEIRLRELMPVVDAFVIAESSSTFTGLPKALAFSENRQRFNFAAKKIRYLAIPGRKLAAGEDPFNIEREMREAVTVFLRDQSLHASDLVIMSDVDEIPSARAIQLLRSCDNIPNFIHLKMKNFMYSFDFLMDSEHWRPKVAVVPANPQDLIYSHRKASDIILADAGWHCSFCFPKISDFVFKMTGYAHADRVHSKYLLDPNRIQKVICEGTDIYDMLPEAYTWRDLAYKWGPMRKLNSAVNAPQFLIDTVALNDTRFRYLLPGGCVRERE